MTAPPSRLEVLDCLRGVAALMVYWHHTGTALIVPPLAVYGFTGVYLFFVLSGYLLFRPYASALLAGRSLPPVGSFYLRRAVRIGPPYLVCLALFTAARNLTGDKPPDAVNVLAHAALVFNYFPSIDFYSINGVFWTLALEAQFYLLLPPLVWVAARAAGSRSPAARVWAAAGAFIGIGIASRVAESGLAPTLYGPDTQVVYRSIFSFLDLFGYGMAAAALELTGRSPRGRSAIAGVLAGSVGLFLAANHLAFVYGTDWVGSRDRTLAFAFPPLISKSMAGFLLVALSPAGSHWPGLNNAPLRFVGLVSYSLYLYHVGVQFVLFKVVNLTPLIPHFQLRGFVYGLLFLVPTLALSAVMFYLVERPCLKLIARRRTGAARP